MENETTFNNFLCGGKLTHGSLFSGIGGFELGAEWAEIPTLWNCEILPYQQKILKQHYPNTKQYADIKELQNPEYCDIISGGFPCQDISNSGTKLGIKGHRSGLWGEMFRIIREVRPKYVIIENSPALIIRGFERVLCDLSEIGYNAEWQCLSGKQFGTTHKRERIYCIAYSDGIGLQAFYEPSGFGIKASKNWEADSTCFSMPNEWLDRPGDSFAIRRGDDVPNKIHRIKGCGNAVMPVIAYYLFSCIKKREEKKLLKVEPKCLIEAQM